MPANMNVVSPPSPSVKSICREHITAVHLQDNPPACLLANSTRLLLSRFLAPHLAVGDEIAFPIPVPDRSTAAGTEVIITKHSSERDRYCYQAPIGYVSLPRKDKRDQFFVSAEVRNPGLGISSVFLPCGALRDHFFHVPVATEGRSRSTFTIYCVFLRTRLRPSCAWPTSSASWNSHPVAPSALSIWPWRGPSTSSLNRNCEPATTGC
jgi:hypothetical protein